MIQGDNDMNRFEKLRIHLRGYALGKEWYRLVRVIEVANAVHSHTRKDGVTPEFQHQLEIASYLMTLGIASESLLIVAILHDLAEDYPDEWEVYSNEFSTLLLQTELVAIKNLNKNLFKTHSHYYSNMSNYLLSALVKGGDRINNVQTMRGAFSVEKMKSYIAESETDVLPMLKTARRQYPEHTLAFLNIETMLKNQIQIYKTFLYSETI